MSLLQILSQRAGVSPRHVQRCLASRRLEGLGLYRVGRRGRWRVRGPVTPARVDRIVEALGLKADGARALDEKAAAVAGRVAGAVRQVVGPLLTALPDPRGISTAIRFIGAQRGQTDDGDGAWLTDEDFTRPLADELRANRSLYALLGAGGALAAATTTTMRLRNRGEKITRARLAAEQGMSSATHRRKFTPAEYRAIKSATRAAVAPRGEGLVDDVAFLAGCLEDMLSAGAVDDSVDALAAFCGMTPDAFRDRYNAEDIGAAYVIEDRRQITEFGEATADQNKREMLRTGGDLRHLKATLRGQRDA